MFKNPRRNRLMQLWCLGITGLVFAVLVTLKNYERSIPVVPKLYRNAELVKCERMAGAILRAHGVAFPKEDLVLSIYGANTNGLYDEFRTTGIAGHVVQAGNLTHFSGFPEGTAWLWYLGKAQHKPTVRGSSGKPFLVDRIAKDFVVNLMPAQKSSDHAGEYDVRLLHKYFEGADALKRLGLAQQDPCWLFSESITVDGTAHCVGIFLDNSPTPGQV